MNIRNRNYQGWGDTWYGKDIAIVPVVKEHCVLSQLRLIDYLGKKPVADIILFNMIKYCSNELVKQ